LLLPVDSFEVFVEHNQLRQPPWRAELSQWW
jgi:hypothetical protein